MRLRVRAAHHGRSMEEEAREILRSALRPSPAGKQNLSEAIRRRFAEFGGLELELVWSKYSKGSKWRGLVFKGAC